MLSVRLGEDLEERLAKVAKQCGSSRSSIVRRLLRGAIEELEEYGQAVEALRKQGIEQSVKELLGEEGSE